MAGTLFGLRSSFFLIGALIALPAAQASLSDLQGVGSRSSALAGVGAALDSDAFSATLNPALLAAPSARRVRLAWGLVYLEPSVEDIGPVLVENPTISDQFRSASVEGDYRPTFGQFLGVAAEIDPEFYHWSFGALLYLPMNQIAVVDSGEPFVPEYVLYRSRTLRPMFEFATAISPGEGWGIGVGGRLSYAATALSSVFLQTDTARSSSMRISATLKPRVVPYFGVSKEFESGRLGLVIRLPSSPVSQVDVKAGTQALGNLAALDFRFSALSTLEYDPLSVELGGSLALGDSWVLQGQVDYQRWSVFESPAMVIELPSTETCAGGSCGVQFSSSRYTSPRLRDIWIPRVGAEHRLSPSWVLRAGYAYRPGIYSDLPSTGNSNPLDPDRWIGAIGAGYRWDGFLGFEEPADLDFHLQYQSLTEESVRKTNSNEIGAPGYTVGGRWIGTGLSLRIGL